MGFEVSIIQILQTASNAFTDGLFKLITMFGEELVFMVVAVIVYWCVDKKFAYRFFNVYLLSALTLEGMKHAFRRPRPFDAYSDKVVSIGDKTSGYSFPSGHSHSIANVSTQLTLKYGKNRIYIPIVGAILTVAVMISRMYLGQHYLSDVIAGALCGIWLPLAFNALMALIGDNEEWFAVGAVAITVIVISVLAGTHSLEGAKSIVTGSAAFGAFSIGYVLEKRFVRYDIKAGRKPWKIALRIIIGLGVAVAIKEGFKLFLPKDIIMLHDFLRYALVALWATVGACSVFKLLKI